MWNFMNRFYFVEYNYLKLLQASRNYFIFIFTFLASWGSNVSLESQIYSIHNYYLLLFFSLILGFC